MQLPVSFEILHLSAVREVSQITVAMVNTDDELVDQCFHFRSSLVVFHNGLIEPLVGRQHRLPEIPAIDASER